MNDGRTDKQGVPFVFTDATPTQWKGKSTSYNNSGIPCSQLLRELFTRCNILWPIFCGCVIVSVQQMPDTSVVQHISLFVHFWDFITGTLVNPILLSPSIREGWSCRSANSFMSKGFFDWLILTSWIYSSCVTNGWRSERRFVYEFFFYVFAVDVIVSS